MLEVSLLPFTEIVTPRLVLRQVVPADAEAVFALRSDERMMKFLGRPMAKTIDDAIAMVDAYTQALEKNEGITWAVCLKEDRKMIGTLGFWRMDKANYRTEIGYMLHIDHWRKGYMHEAIQAGLNYAFKQLKFHSVEANADPRNEASTAILEKCGFVREAYFKENFFFNGVFQDSVIYSILSPL
jgi:[ribosomal protein S5]-alanine N-acetyltransferase